MTTKRLDVKCGTCGKEGKALIILNKILSFRWVYWGMTLDDWECKHCYNTAYNFKQK